MAINSDFRDLFVALNAAGCRYLLVGGYAMAAHGAPRFTKDLDIWVEPKVTNAARVVEALTAFGAPREHLVGIDLTAPDTIFQIGVPPSRIDIIASIDGVTFEGAWAGKASMSFGGVPITVLGRRQMIQNKRAVGRLQDLADAERLEQFE
ncbi:nucleotidyl transferase AbiEii/AbiGii toxin family protein [soil metagenome]